MQTRLRLATGAAGLLRLGSATRAGGADVF